MILKKSWSCWKVLKLQLLTVCQRSWIQNLVSQALISSHFHNWAQGYWNLRYWLNNAAVYIFQRIQLESMYLCKLQNVFKSFWELICLGRGEAFLSFLLAIFYLSENWAAWGGGRLEWGMRVINDTHRKFREALEELFYRLVWVDWSFMHMPLQQLHCNNCTMCCKSVAHVEGRTHVGAHHHPKRCHCGYFNSRKTWPVPILQHFCERLLWLWIVRLAPVILMGSWLWEMLDEIHRTSSSTEKPPNHWLSQGPQSIFLLLDFEKSKKLWSQKYINKFWSKFQEMSNYGEDCAIKASLKISSGDGILCFAFHRRPHGGQIIFTGGLMVVRFSNWLESFQRVGWEPF